MKNLLYTLMISALMIAGAGQVQAQKKCDEGWKEKMMSEKIAFLTHELNITPIEAQTFWPVYNKIEKAHVLIAKMIEGQNIALITDAGTPGISDPGEDLVRLCYEAGIHPA